MTSLSNFYVPVMQGKKEYIKRSVIFQDITNDSVNKIHGFQSNYPLIVSGFASFLDDIQSSYYENYYVMDDDCSSVKLVDWIFNLFGPDISNMTEIRKNLIFQRYNMEKIIRFESMLHTYLNEFGIYRIWNGVYDHVKLKDHKFFMRFLIILSFQQRLEKKKMIEMATEYFDNIESQGESRIDSKISNHLFESIQRNPFYNAYFKPSLSVFVEEPELNDFCPIITVESPSSYQVNPSPYMWDIHYRMKDKIDIVSPHSRISTPVIEEEKIELGENALEKIAEMDRIVKEVVSYVMILFTNETIRESILDKIMIWKEEKSKNIHLHMDMNVRNEILQMILFLL